MPINIVTINGKEYEIPDSWMSPLWEYVQVVRREIEQRTDETPPEMPQPGWWKDTG